MLMLFFRDDLSKLFFKWDMEGAIIWGVFLHHILILQLCRKILIVVCQIICSGTIILNSENFTG